MDGRLGQGTLSLPYIASPTGCNSTHGDHKSTKLQVKLGIFLKS